MVTEDNTQERDRKIAIIQERLKTPMHPDIRKKFEGLLAQLQGDVKTLAKAEQRPQERRLEAKAAAPTPPEPLPKRTVTIWTPHGDVEVVGEEPRHEAPKKVPMPGAARVATDAERDEQNPARAASPETCKSASRTDTVPLPLSSVLTGAEDGEREPTREEKRLMLLTGIRSLDALNRFLNSPDLPPETTRMKSPDEEYDRQQKLDEKQENQENQELMGNAPAGSGPTRIAPTVGAGFRRYGPILGCILALLLAAFSDWPYGFYELLRLGVCTVSLYWAVEMFKQKQTVWAWALGANAVLFNPLLPIHMAREQWEIVDLLDGIFLASFTCISFYRDRRTDRSTLSGDSRS
jgi:hypothetical protein